MNGFKFRTKTLVSVVLLILCFGLRAHATPGDLDTSFGGDGKVTTSFGSSTFANANAVAIQSNGKIVVAGQFQSDFALARYNSNGSLDTTFGVGGKVTTSFGFVNNFDEANAVAIQADGKIVAAGKAGISFALARYNVNGSLDNTFSGDGKQTTLIQSLDSSANGIAIQADGRIVLAGTVTEPQLGAAFAVARYRTDGNLDTTFSPAGVVTFISSGPAVARAIAIHPDGRIVVAGRSGSEFALARYNTNGALDATFNGNGTVTTSFGPLTDASANAVAIDNAGRIVVAGRSGIHTAVARYNAFGSLDTTFSRDGMLTTDFDFGYVSEAHGIAIQADGKIVVAGGVDSFTFTVARYTSSGARDTTFSGDGQLTTAISSSCPRGGAGRAVAIQEWDGRIVVAGVDGCSTGVAASSSFALARYHAFECNGKNATIVGTSGPDNLSGDGFFNNPFNDVIVGLGGDDIIHGGGGDDTICGESGNDTIFGEEGNDALFGGAGNDVSDGGTGTDTCVDSVLVQGGFPGCETVTIGNSGFSGVWEDVSQHCNQSSQNPQCRLEGTIAVVNPGTETTAVPSVAAFYRSSDETWDENDEFLEYVEVGVLDAGETQDVKLNVKVEGAQDLSGKFVIAVLDFFDIVPEVNEANNVVVSPELP